MTRFGGPFEPAIDGIPGDLLDASNGGLVQAFDAEGGNLVEGRATMLEPMVRCPGVRAEGLTVPRTWLCCVPKMAARILPVAAAALEDAARAAPAARLPTIPVFQNRVISLGQVLRAQAARRSVKGFRYS